MQIEGGDKDTSQSRDPIEDEQMESEEENMEDPPSLEETEDETSPTRKNLENAEQVRQDKVVGDTSAIGSIDYLGPITSIGLQ